jgi:hypothetical protein
MRATGLERKKMRTSTLFNFSTAQTRRLDFHYAKDHVDAGSWVGATGAARPVENRDREPSRPC